MLLPTLVGALLLGVFAIDLGFATFGAPQAATPQASPQVFTSWRGIRIAIDLAGLAIAGGLFIVPVVRRGAVLGRRRPARPRDRGRQRAQCAASSSAARCVVAALQKPAHVTMPQLFLLIGVANLVALVWIARTMPANGLRDFLTTMLRALLPHGGEGRGEPRRKAGPNPIIALNHVSFLDAAWRCR